MVTVPQWHLIILKTLFVMYLTLLINLSPTIDVVWAKKVVNFILYQNHLNLEFIFVITDESYFGYENLNKRSKSSMNKA